eukprot:SAG31_NODE_21340_length_552_cov_0.757174_2_plen_31_part_01
MQYECGPPNDLDAAGACEMKAPVVKHIQYHH